MSQFGNESVLRGIEIEEDDYNDNEEYDPLPIGIRGGWCNAILLNCYVFACLICCSCFMENDGRFI